MDGIVHILWIMMVTREQLSENRVFDRTRPEYKESAKIALSEGLIADFSDSLGGRPRTEDYCSDCQGHGTGQDGLSISTSVMLPIRFTRK